MIVMILSEILHSPGGGWIDTTIDGRVGMYWLNRRYRLDEPVGAGGSGVVWRGHDARLRRPVAVKTPPPGPADHRRRRLLRREALMAAGLNHPHIVSVYDYGETTDGVPFLVLELVDGITVTQLLASRGPLSPADTASVCAGVASALAAIHARGLVHGDLKPDNVMICRTGARILDLGTARSIGQHPWDRPMTAGTPAFMAPEQTDATAAPEAGVYAFGLLLRECLTARHSRPDADPPHVRTARTGRWPWLPDSVPGHLRDLVTTCLSLEPADRPTAARAAAVLRRSGRERPTARAQRRRDGSRLRVYRGRPVVARPA
jgi:serine/threonine-protein kinase